MTTNVCALEILRRRYIGDDPVRLANVEREVAKAHLSQAVYDARRPWD
jgi:hypothetical protein